MLAVLIRPRLDWEGSDVAIINGDAIRLEL